MLTQQAHRKNCDRITKNEKLHEPAKPPRKTLTMAADEPLFRRENK